MQRPPTKLEEALERAASIIVGALLAGIVGMYLYVLFIVASAII